VLESARLVGEAQLATARAERAAAEIKARQAAAAEAAALAEAQWRADAHESELAAQTDADAADAALAQAEAEVLLARLAADAETAHVALALQAAAATAQQLRALADAADAAEARLRDDADDAARSAAAARKEESRVARLRAKSLSPKGARAHGDAAWDRPCAPPPGDAAKDAVFALVAASSFAAEGTEQAEKKAGTPATNGEKLEVDFEENEAAAKIQSLQRMKDAHAVVAISTEEVIINERKTQSEAPLSKLVSNAGAEITLEADIQARVSRAPINAIVFDNEGVFKPKGGFLTQLTVQLRQGFLLRRRSSSSDSLTTIDELAVTSPILVLFEPAKHVEDISASSPVEKQEADSTSALSAAALEQEGRASAAGGVSQQQAANFATTTAVVAVPATDHTVLADVSPEPVESPAAEGAGEEYGPPLPAGPPLALHISMAVLSATVKLQRAARLSKQRRLASDAESSAPEKNTAEIESTPETIDRYISKGMHIFPLRSYHTDVRLRRDFSSNIQIAVKDNAGCVPSMNAGVHSMVAVAEVFSRYDWVRACFTRLAVARSTIVRL
jgi:hypothetical protein